jgi:hypothetical protein
MKHGLLLTVAGLGALWIWAEHHDAERQKYLNELAPAKPDFQQTWEGEGGALPVTGSQTGPSPSI